MITPMQRWSRAQELALLMWHLLFTSLCPQRCHEFVVDVERVHWDCAGYGWVDDTV